MPRPYQDVLSRFQAPSAILGAAIGGLTVILVFVGEAICPVWQVSRAASFASF